MDVKGDNLGYLHGQVSVNLRPGVSSTIRSPVTRPGGLEAGDKLVVAVN